MILLYHSTLYTDGQPFARFASTLKAAAWLQSVGCKYVRKTGPFLIFQLS